MSQIEHLAVDVHRLRLLVQDDATLLLQISIHPDVVVAGEVMNLHAHVGKLREFAEKPCVALRHHIFVFIPEVEHVAEQIYRRRLMLYVVEKAHQTALVHSAMVYRQRAEVCVR